MFWPRWTDWPKIVAAGDQEISMHWYFSTSKNFQPFFGFKSTAIFTNTTLHSKYGSFDKGMRSRQQLLTGCIYLFRVIHSMDVSIFFALFTWERLLVVFSFKISSGKLARGRSKRIFLSAHALRLTAVFSIHGTKATIRSAISLSFSLTSVFLSSFCTDYHPEVLKFLLCDFHSRIRPSELYGPFR